MVCKLFDFLAGGRGGTNGLKKEKEEGLEFTASEGGGPTIQLTSYSGIRINPRQTRLGVLGRAQEGGVHFTEVAPFALHFRSPLPGLHQNSQTQEANTSELSYLLGVKTLLRATHFRPTESSFQGRSLGLAFYKCCKGFT